MSIQTIIDQAETIEFDRRRIVGQSISRSQRLKTAERASATPWRWIVKPPANMKYSTSRAIIESILDKDRIEEEEVNLARASYLTAYQGQLTAAQRANLRTTATSTASITIDQLPALGATLSSRSYIMTARSFSTLTSVTYNRALDTSRTDFLITTSELDSNWYSIQAGDTVSTTTYITSARTISSITRDYITLDGVSYSRIVMSGAPNSSTTAATTTTVYDQPVQSSLTTTVTNQTIIFKVGDLIQPNGSRYPYSVQSEVVRGTTSTVTATLHRNIISSEGISLTNRSLKIGTETTWRMVLSQLPNYVVLPYDRMTWNGNFEMIEKII